MAVVITHTAVAPLAGGAKISSAEWNDTHGITGLATVAETGDYADLSGRPAIGSAASANAGDFAQSVHTHAIDDVTGLQSAIDAAILNWGYLVANWTDGPSLVTTLDDGDVWSYNHRGTTRFRLVPSPYVSTDDAFYAEFEGGVLSGLIVTRG